MDLGPIAVLIPLSDPMLLQQQDLEDISSVCRRRAPMNSPDRYVVPVPTQRSSVHPLLGKTLAAPCTSDNLSSSSCKKSSLSPRPARGWSLAGSYADENVSSAVGADGVLAVGKEPEEGPAGEGWTGESNLAELKSSCETDGSF